MFEIPIVLFIFKRKDTVLKILKQLSIIQPQKLYIISDNGRTVEEKEQVFDVRKTVENAIQWKCEVIKKYSENNIGVYKNIGEGAKWVFSREKIAIFLEDDNLPEISFFRFCKEMLYKYEKNKQILWICGTNYLGKYLDAEQSYYFTQHMLPCGWASWGEKFLNYYDGELSTLEEKDFLRIKKTYILKSLFFQEKNSILKTKYTLENNIARASWDRQMNFTIRKYNLYGIIPSKNQIKNIGVDEYSTHNGNSFDKIMTKRFCGMESYSLDFPLIHPKQEKIGVNKKLELKLSKIILYPLRERFKIILGIFLKKFLRKNIYQSYYEMKKQKSEKKK